MSWQRLVAIFLLAGSTVTVPPASAMEPDALVLRNVTIVDIERDLLEPGRDVVTDLAPVSRAWRLLL